MQLHRSNQARRAFAIVGGGASGVILAAHLLREPSQNIEVTIIEKRRSLGRGLAYSTTVVAHVLNVRASNMSAFAKDPGDFTRWLQMAGVQTDDFETFFAPRSLYGDYLEQLVASHVESGRLRFVDEECVDVVSRGSALELRLVNGASEICDFCVLATGHGADERRGGSLLCPSADANAYPQDPDEPVMILGTGLSMIDSCLALILKGHRGPIVAVSRRGLLPTIHRKTAPIVLDASDIPFGRPLLVLLRWFRGLVRAQLARGGDWRDVVDGLRSHTQAIWRHLPLDSRRQFFRHLKSWWDVHRHRMAPQSYHTLSGAIDSGQLQIIAGRVENMEADVNGMAVRIKRRQGGLLEAMRVSRLYDCRGVIADPEQQPSRLLQSLFASGMARADVLRIGLDVADDGALIDRNGIANARLYALGPLTRGAFLEIEAVPDIRIQCQHLARRLLADADMPSIDAASYPNAKPNPANPVRAAVHF
ncbi:MAG: FAD/NAD(P)-binding protein [Rhizobiaceae bacterium]